MTASKEKTAVEATEKPANTRVGRGMKPRGEQAPAANTVSADAVQNEAPKDAVSGTQEGEQTPPNQEPEKVENGTPEPNPMRSSLEQMIADSAAAHGTPEVKPETLPPDAVGVIPAGAIAMARMAPHSGGIYVYDGQGGHSIPPEAMPDMSKDSGYRHEVVKGEGDEVTLKVYRKPDEAAVAILRAGEDGSIYVGTDPEDAAVSITRLGTLPNGDFAVVIKIPEFFVQSVKDFAETDGGKSVEQWCTEFFTMNLEAYCTPQKGR